MDNIAQIYFCLGGTSQKYQEVFLARLLSCVSSTQPEVRQAAAYGCGVLGQCGGPGYAQVYALYAVLTKNNQTYSINRSYPQRLTV